MRGPDAWLSQNTQYGDLVLTGGSDFVSKSIQFVSRGRYSHATIVIDDGRVLEAIDYVNEDQGGLFATPYSTLCGRDGGIRISAFRPKGLDEAALRRAIDQVQSAQPTFDSAGILLLGALRISEFVHRRLRPTSVGEHGRPASAFRERLGRLADLAGDGLHRMHCAELVTRLYAEAGLELVFENPTFLHLLSDLDPPPGNRSRHLDKIRSTRDNTVTHASLPRINSVAGIAANRATAIRIGEKDPPSPKWLVRQFAGTAAGRMDEQTHADPADFISPSDLAKAQPFRRIGTMHLDRRKWRTTTGPSAS